MRHHRDVTESLEIREAGLLLRPWRTADAEAVHRACQDPEIARWTSVPSPYGMEHAHGFVTDFARAAWASGTAAPLGVFDAATGELLGANGLGRLERDHRTGEVGYWVAPWARGRGVATNATRAVARWSLETLGLRRLAWRAEIGNHASRVVAERVGFRLEGVLRSGALHRGGTYVDCWSAAVLPGELREADAPVDRIAARRAAVFSRPQPRLVASPRSGGEIGLRPLAERDLEAIVAACRDPESVRWTNLPDPYTIDDARFFVHEYAPGRWARGDGFVFAVTDAQDAFAGSLAMRIPAPDTGDVGYLIAPWARRRGYAETGLRAACRWAFEALALHRIEWRAYLDNVASRRTAERAGFTIEGAARAASVQRGEYRDAWTGSLLATDPSAAMPAVFGAADVGRPGMA